MKSNADSSPTQAGFVNYNSPLVPKIKINFKTFDPLDVTAEVKWKLAKDLEFLVTLHYQATTTMEYSADNGEKSQITTQSGKWTFTMDIKYEHSPDVSDLFNKARLYNKYAKSLKDSHDADMQLKDIEGKLKAGNLNPEQKEKLLLQKQIAQTSVDYANLDKHFLKMQNKKAAMLQLETLTQYYRAQVEDSDSVIKFVQLFFPVFSGVAATVDAGVVLDFSISATLQAKIVVTSTVQTGSVSSENGHRDFNNSTYEISASIGLIGKVEFKFGAQLGIGVTVAGVLNLKVIFEGGIYVELNALGALYMGSAEELGMSFDEALFGGEMDIGNDIKLAGLIDFDIGSYFLFKTKVSLDLWILEISKTFEIATVKKSFIKNQEEKNSFFQELVFENATNLTTFEDVLQEVNSYLLNGERYDSTPTFELDNVFCDVTLPNVYIRTINLKTGEITYKKVNPNNLVYINEDQVYGNGLLIKQSNVYDPEVDNRLNIRVMIDGVIDEELYLPIRILK